MKRMCATIQQTMIFALCFASYFSLVHVSRSQDFVTPQWVYENLGKHPEFLLMDTAYIAPNSSALYTESHLPTARYFDLNQIQSNSEILKNHPVHPLEFEEIFRSLGVDKDSHVILYDHGELHVRRKSIMSTTFAHWMLQAFGFYNVSIMQGGLKAWLKLGDPTTSRIDPLEKRGNFKSGWNRREITTYDDVIENFETKKAILVDTRPMIFFNASFASGYAKSKGRIRGK